jgi:hypothetical protein
MEDQGQPIQNQNPPPYIDPNYGDPYNPMMSGYADHAGLIRSDQQAFINEQLARNTMLWDTDLKEFGTEHLDALNNSVGFVNTWKRLVVGLFDRTKILGILNPKTFSYEEAVLRYRLRVNLAKCHYETFDLDTPQSLTVPIDTENDFRFFLTRAVDGKEREYQSRIMFGNENSQTSIIKDMRAPNGGKKRFFGLF